MESHIRRANAETGVAMKPVVQLERTGCGFADDPRLWSETHYVHRLLKQYGIRPARVETPFISWEALPDCALLAVKWHIEEDRAFWHWVVFWRGPHGPVVLDSKRALRKHKRTDFGRIKPKWFIPIAGC
jgi:hypothetical protein